MTQIISEQPHRCFTTDLSAIGLYAERLVEPFERNSRIVQIEIPLPGTSDAIWAKGEVVYDNFDSLFHGTAIRYTAMARFHQRMLREWLREAQRAQTRMADYSRRLDGEVVILRPAKKLAIAA
ncbi:MAG: hypothetical protein JXA30_18685 [Deltaproteobacteria bacterium]|nr:hypothetical protein [Deltaproteobacteria bacterium]